MKRAVVIYMLIGLLSLISCSGPGDKSEKDTITPTLPGESTQVKTEIKEGIPHIYNSTVPLKGVVKLELEKVCEIDSSTLNQGEPVSFNIAVRSPLGRIYLCDNRAFKIYIFDETGKLLNRFLKQGEGPGEFRQWYEYSIQQLDNDVWVPGSLKVARFTPDGKFLEEVKFTSPYHQLEVVADDRFIVNYYIFPANQANANTQRKDACSLIDRNETILTKFSEEIDAGGSLIRGKLPDGSYFNVNFSLDVISPTLLHCVSLDRQRVYINLSSDYKITVKNLQGESLRVIHRDYQYILLTDQDRKEIIEDIFFRQPPHVKKLIQENLPTRFCAVMKLISLPGGYLAVLRPTGIQRLNIDIFDGEGRYLYQLELPQDIGKRVGIAGDIISAVYFVEDRDIYRAYRIKNLPGIFKSHP